VRQSAGAVSSAARMTTRQLFKTCILMCLYHIDVSMSMCRSTHVSDEFSIPFTFGAATVRCFTSNLIQPLLWVWPRLVYLTGHTRDTVRTGEMDGGGIATGLTSNALTDRLQRTSGSAPLAQRGSRRDPLTIQSHTLIPTCWTEPSFLRPLRRSGGVSAKTEISD
jgi:hypothetical protein